MVDYIEEYLLPPNNRSYRLQAPLEDNEYCPLSGQIMHPKGEIRLWAGGGAIGHAPTIEEARRVLWTYRVSELSAEVSSLQDRLMKNTRALNFLSPNVERLWKYRNWNLKGK